MTCCAQRNGLSVLISMSPGIVVDGTVHFLSKYLRVRREQGLDAVGAVRYAFSTAGTALRVTPLYWWPALRFLP